MYIAFLIKDTRELDKSERIDIDLHVIRGYSSSTSIVDGNITRKHKYYCNFTLRIDEMHDTLLKINNMSKSEKQIKKFKL